MILVDPRIGSNELLSPIRQFGVPVQLCQLEYGDACFDGNGPKGTISVGMERKKLQDMLHSIDDSRYSAHQLPGMAKLYDKSILIVEGAWKPNVDDGTLMEGFNGKWTPCRYRSQRTLYSKLRRYLISISLSGVIITYSRNLEQTAYDICEHYHYFQKRWDQHTSLQEMQKLNIPCLNGKPSLVRKWAADIDSIGVKLSQEAEELFKTPIALAESLPSQWTSIKGIGQPTAEKIVQQIRGK